MWQQRACRNEGPRKTGLGGNKMGGGVFLAPTPPVRWGLSLGPSTTIPWWGTNLHGSSCPMHLGVHEPGPHAQGTSAGHRTLNIPKVGRGTLEDTGGRVRWRTQHPVPNTDHSERQSPDISRKHRRACSKSSCANATSGHGAYRKQSHLCPALHPVRPLCTDLLVRMETCETNFANSKHI